MLSEIDVPEKESSENFGFKELTQRVGNMGLRIVDLSAA